jgi:long-chain acyl-CoA synthetase
MSMFIKRAQVPILTQVVDSIVFSAVREQMGGRLRFVFNGGAPVSIETQGFLSLVLAPISQGGWRLVLGDFVHCSYSFRVRLN